MDPDHDPLQQNFHSRIQALYVLEETCLPTPYLSEGHIQLVQVGNDPLLPQHPNDSYRGCETLLSWRLTIGEWVFRVVDHCKFPREAAGVCMNFIDRCMSSLARSENPQLNMRKFQLLSTACLYLACKVSAPDGCYMSAGQMAHLSNQLFSAQQIVDAEWDVLKTLQWRLLPPTNHVFLYYYSRLIDDQVRWVKVVEDARFSVELALLDHELMLRRPSHVALAALLNAIADAVGTLVSAEEHAVLDREFRKQTLLDGQEETLYIRFCQVRLREVHQHSMDSLATVESSNLRPLSPVSVANGVL